jgi:hypothetical protein
MIKQKLIDFDKTFDKFQQSAIGKFIIEKVVLRKASFYSLISFFGTYLLIHLTTYSKAEQWATKISEQLDTSEGWLYAGWFVLSWILPSGDIFPIIIIVFLLGMLGIIRYKELNQSKALANLIPKLEEKTKNILFEIRTSIKFNDTKIEIDRCEVIEQIKEELDLKQVFILSGIGGAGKTSIIKSMYENKDQGLPFYVFKARTFQDANLFLNHSLEEFIGMHNEYAKKIVVIDSAEALLDFESEYFKEVISALISNEWKVIFTTRYTYLDDLNYYFSQILNIIPFKIDIKNLTSDELESLSNKHEFNLPQDEKLKSLIENPFYLNEYLYYTTDENVNYQEFKKTLWNRNITSSNPQREECFLKLANKRANEGLFYLNIECAPDSLELLRKDGILGYEKAGYFIAHDIYEEWALNEIIERAYTNRLSESDFFIHVGNSLPIRRAFRNWISEKLLLNDENIKVLIDNVVDNSSIESFWKDEIFISVLLSDYSDTFFESFKRELISNEYEFICRISFLLRLACKDVDNSFFENIGLKNQQTIETKYIFTQPKGKGWESYIAFVYKNIETIKLNRIQFILPVLADWCTKFKKGATTRYAALIALKYCELINQLEHKYSYRENIQTICKILSFSSSEVTNELRIAFEEFLQNNIDKENAYYELSKMILTDFNGLELCKNLPETTFKLADLMWTKRKVKNKESSIFYHEREDVEDAFGISSKYEHKYHPASAIQTPIYFLLRQETVNTIDFIISFINKSVKHYVDSNWKYKENIKIVDVDLGEHLIQQYHSEALWNIYRGISSPVMPELLQSVHMALEKYLLEIADAPDLSSEVFELILLNILSKSKSSSITAVLTSIVLAKPHKCFRLAIILFKRKEFIQADFLRSFKDLRETKMLYGMGYGLNWKTKIFQDERLKTCQDKHRNLNLEDLLFRYQTFTTEEITEENAKEIQEELWAILDNHYKNLPAKEKQSDEDRSWRIALARMDRRTVNIETKKVDNEVQMKFEAKLAPELKIYSEKVQKESLNTTKYTTLYLWSLNKVEDNDDYLKYKNYEENPLLSLEEIKEVLSTPHEERDYIFQDEILANVSIVLLRDYSNLLQDEDKNLCKDLLLEFAYLPLQDKYYYQISDGIEKTINYLPILVEYFPELVNDIKVLLLLYLFNNSPIGNSGGTFNDYAIKSILDYFETEVESFIWAYIILKPKYKEKIQFNYAKKEATKQELVEEFFKENDQTLDKFLSNKEIDFDIIELDKYDLEELVVAFKMIKKVPYHVDKGFIQSIIKICSINTLNKKVDEDYRYESKQQFIDTFANFLLENEKSDILFYLEPIVNQFQPNEEIVDFLTQLVYTQDKVKEYDNFWYVWELFEDKIVEICKDGDGYGHIDGVIKVYLFSIGRYGSLWNDNVKEWDSFKEKDKRFIKRMSEKIGHCPSTLYAISAFLTSIGSSFLNDGISWIANIVRGNSDILCKKVDSNTIFHLEIIVRKYVFINATKIKKERKLREDTLIILNMLVEKGSSLGYMLREKIL